MNNLHLISVIIPHYNRWPLVAESIQSVIDQSDQTWELIVVDDGSAIGQFKELYNFIEELADSRIKLVRMEENGGVSKARNLGMRKAKGQLISFLDSDDQWLVDKLKFQRDYLSNNPDILLCHGEELWIRNGKRVNQKKIHQKSGGDLFERSLRLCLISPSAVIFRKELLEIIGPMNERLPVCEDYDWWLKVTARMEVGFIEDPLIKKFGGHEDQLSRKYVAMDYWRIKALGDLLKSKILSAKKVELVNEEIIYKAKILINGYQKHQRWEKLEQLKYYLKQFTKVSGPLAKYYE